MIPKLLEVISELAERLDDVEDQLRHDQLTGALSRTGLAWQWELYQPSTIMFVDIDEFKRINDTYGHAAGDEILTSIASQLGKLAPDRVVRLGGDEFAVLVDADESPQSLAADITGGLADPIGDEAITVTVSIGWAAVADDGDLAATLRRADIAMYHAKTHRSPSPPVGWTPGLDMPGKSGPGRRTIRDRR